MQRIRSMSHSAAVVLTAALVAALFAGGSAFAVKALTKQDAKKLFYTKKKADKTFLKSSAADSTFLKQADANNGFVRTGSASSGSSTGAPDLGPSYVDLATTSVTTNGGRILATANVNLRDTTANVNQVECTLRVGGETIDGYIVTVQDGTGADRVTTTLVGSTGNLPAGTHSVVVRCGEAAALPGVFADSARVIAWNG